MPIQNIVGRKQQIRIFERVLSSGETEFIAVYGRRRVGKTFLIREYFGQRICFEIIGLYEAGLKEQLSNFAQSMKKAGNLNLPIPASWSEAFLQLESYYEQLKKKKRKEKWVIFIDELPWLHTARSGFLTALQQFWNSYASRQQNMVLIVSGSAASWMIQNIVRAKGGLHNRLTMQIRLLPFTLNEMQELLKKHNILKLSHYELIRIYMATGGVPYYLKFLQNGLSSSQQIDELFFKQSAPLRNEYQLLFESLFTNSDQHRKIIELLAESWNGASRNEILQKTGITSGGTVSLILDELMESGFIEPWIPFGKNSNDQLYRLWDEYALFYLKWIKPLGKRTSVQNYWLSRQNSPAIKTWSGYCFENICMKHVDKIREKLGIAGVETQVSTWRYHPDLDSDIPGAQIDLLIDRKDGVITICEMKFYDSEFTITSAYAQELRQKVDVFRRVTGTRKSIFLTLVTPFGVVKNKHYHDLGISDIKADALFRIEND